MREDGTGGDGWHAGVGWGAGMAACEHARRRAGWRTVDGSAGAAPNDIMVGERRRAQRAEAKIVLDGKTVKVTSQKLV